MTRVGISPHVARLRAAVGHELIVLASVSVTGTQVRLTGLLGAFGGPDYEVTRLTAS